MNLSTIFRFFLGQRDAVQQIAGCRQCWLVGFLFVLSAALAREYDGESLSDEPWHLAIPLVASLLAATVLYLLVNVVAYVRRQRPDFWSNFPKFIGLFWMTAPLALLYGIPYEQFLSEVRAVEINLWTLALVAGWRVLLMARIISIMFRWRYLPAFLVTLLFADVVVLIALNLVPLPTFAIMGGIHVSAADRLLAEVNLLVQIGGALTLLVWLVGTIVVTMLPTSRVVGSWSWHAQRPSGLVWAGGLAAILVWLPFLPAAQRLQRNRYLAEQYLKQGQFSGAFEMMNRLGPQSFPRYWDPPPRNGFGKNQPPLDQLAIAISDPAVDLEPWAAEKFVRKLGGMFGLDPTKMGEADLARYVDWLERTDRGPAIAWSHRYHLTTDQENSVSPQFMKLLDRIASLGKKADEARH